MRMMNILHVIAGIDPISGGTTTALRNILLMESNLGINHEVLTINWGPSDPEILGMVPVYAAVPAFPARYARSHDAIRWMRDNARRFDLCLIHGIWSWLPWKVAGILTGMKKPYIICPHGSLDPFDIRKKKYAKKILGAVFVRGMLGRAAAVLCTSEKEAELVERYGSHPRMTVLPLPVPFKKNTTDGKVFRKRWGLNDDDFVFLFLSRINYKKGLEILIPAFAKLVSEIPNARLVIAGSDREGYSALVKHWIMEWNIQPRVIFPGFIQGQEKEQALAGSDSFILPSLNENFALAVVEALASGLPVIISENVYIKEEIMNANAGWVCKFSVDSLFEVMKHALLHKTDYGDKRKNAVAFARRYSPEQIGTSYLTLFEELLNQGGKPLQ